MPTYNEIEEHPQSFVLWKNPDLPVAGTLPFKDIIIEWGQDGTKVKIRRILYPKHSYDRAAVEKIAEATLHCPFCTEGKTPTTLTSEGLGEYAPPPLPIWDDSWKQLQRDWNKFWGIPSL
jgi:hypothetical protein